MKTHQYRGYIFCTVYTTAIQCLNRWVFGGLNPLLFSQPPWWFTS